MTSHVAHMRAVSMTTLTRDDRRADATYVISLHVLHTGTVSSIAVTSLLIELLVNTLRAIYIGLDPASSQLVLSVTTQSILFSCSMSMGTLTTTLTALFFLESMGNHTVTASSFLQNTRTRILFIGISLCVVLAHLFFSLAYANSWVHAGLMFLVSDGMHGWLASRIML